MINYKIFVFYQKTSFKNQFGNQNLLILCKINMYKNAKTESFAEKF